MAAEDSIRALVEQAGSFDGLICVAGSAYAGSFDSMDSADLGLGNGALNGFVVNAALEMPNGLRLNRVSPSAVSESVAKYGEPKKRQSIPAGEVAKAYKQTGLSTINGQVLKAYGQRR